MGTLFVVATPIGNLEDISLRATKTLSLVDVILCEDTRRTGAMLTVLNIPYKKLQSYYDQIETQQTPGVISMLESGQNVALVSDAGTPLINDPGYVLVCEARKRDIPVVSIPGASALLTALTSSGLPANTFFYLGYPPEKKSKRFKLFQSLRDMHELIDSTYVFYCAPHKLNATLEDLRQALGDIVIVVARELTKMHEEYWTGTLSEAKHYFQEPKGEFVLLLHLSDASTEK